VSARKAVAIVGQQKTGDVDFTNIQEAIDKVYGQGGGDVFIRSERTDYKTTSQIILKDGVNLIGEDAQTTVLNFMNGALGITYLSQNTPTGLRIENLSITNTADYALDLTITPTFIDTYVSQQAPISIRNLVIRDCRYGIELTLTAGQAPRSILENCSVSVSEIALSLLTNSPLKVNKNFLSGDVGIDLVAVQKLSCSQNDIYTAGTNSNAFWVRTTGLLYDSSFTDNYVDECINGFYLQSSSLLGVLRNSFVGNKVPSAVGGYPMYLDEALGNTVVANAFSGSNSTTLTANSSSNIVVANRASVSNLGAGNQVANNTI
jgi:hypothetical protein